MPPRKSKRLTDSFVLNLLVDYNTSPDMTIELLQETHSLTDNELEYIKTHRLWNPLTKSAPESTNEVIDDIITEPEPQSKPPVVTLTPPPTIEPQDANDPNELQTEIDNFKKHALSLANTFIQASSGYVDVKELKDMVAIVDTIEKSIKQTGPLQPGEGMNVYVQNIINNFKDDC